MEGLNKDSDINELCDSFNKNTLTDLNKLPKIKLFLKLSKFDETLNEIKIINVDEFIGDFKKLSLGNGGSWCRREAWKNHKVATMKRNGTISYLWKSTDEENIIVKKEFSCCKITKGVKIQYIGIFGIINHNTNRLIRRDIKNYYSNLSCCVCGSNSSVIPDHKNDLYNDMRVLNQKTQNFEDFQPLCNHCNLQKRQVCKKTKETNKRYGATNIQMLKIFKIDFIEGDETYDSSDINALKGTFWYDPIIFMKTIKQNKI